jgi:hypothetical protein
MYKAVLLRQGLEATPFTGQVAAAEHVQNRDAYGRSRLTYVAVTV